MSDTKGVFYTLFKSTTNGVLTLEKVVKELKVSVHSFSITYEIRG